MMYLLYILLVALFAPMSVANTSSFREDVEFLSRNVEVIILKSEDGLAQVAVAPAYQGRVMTSTAAGPDGQSFGWINRDLIASGKIEPHINVFGGEDRFWMGPEGGQFSIFFPEDAPFDLEHWQTPAFIDTEPYELVSQSQSEAVFTHTATVSNRYGATFKVKIDRKIRLNVSPDSILGGLSTAKIVDYVSENTVTNVGDAPWTKDTGLLSIWILGMFCPSPETTVVIPFRPGSEIELGPKVNDVYFGKVPEDKLKVCDSVLFFSGDGTYRSKIGIGPKRALEVLGSYTPSENKLTLVQYNKPERAADYVNSMWEIQEHPFAGDVVNSYNDGPPEPGNKPLGPFYELETSSPAAALAPGESITHVHRTSHIIAEPDDLERIARDYFGVGLEEITRALTK